MVTDVNNNENENVNEVEKNPDGADAAIETPEEKLSENSKVVSKKKKEPKYLSNPNKARSLILGFVLTFFLSSLFSFIYNIRLMYLANHTIKRIEDFFLIDKCISNIFVMMFGLSFFSIGITFFTAAKWKKQIWLSLILVGVGIYYLQYLKIPHLQRLMVAKKIYEEKKWVPPFVRSEWDSLASSDLKKIIDTKMKISVQISPGVIEGIDNSNGSRVWSVNLPKKAASLIYRTIFASGSSLYYAQKNSIISRNIMSGSRNWKAKMRIAKTSNFSRNEKLLSFYCKRCKIPKFKEEESKNKFFGYLVLLNDEDGSFKEVIPIRESIKDRKSATPVVHLYKNQVFVLYERRAKLLVVNINNKKIVNTKLEDFFKPREDIKEHFQKLREGKSVFQDLYQKAKFYKKNLFFNSSKRLSVFDLENQSIAWVLNKGFLESEEEVDDDLNYTFYSNIMIIIEGDVIYAINYKNGKLIWGPKTGGFVGTPVMVRKTLYAYSAENGGTIFVFQPSRGKYLYSWNQHREIKEFFLWNNFLLFHGEDNIGISRRFAYLIK